MRTIDADALIAKLKDEMNGMNDGIAMIYTQAAINELKHAPTVDAVEVIRCKDCKHRDAENCLCEGRGWPMQLVPDDGFCDKGERSEEWMTPSADKRRLIH